MKCENCDIEFIDDGYSSCTACRLNNSMNAFASTPKKKTRKEKSH